MRDYETRKIENDYNYAITCTKIERIERLLNTMVTSQKRAYLKRQLRKLNDRLEYLAMVGEDLDCELGDIKACEWEQSYLNGEI